MVSEPAPKMASGSAMEALWENIAQMEEMLGEWLREDDTVALWAEYTVTKIQV